MLETRDERHPQNGPVPRGAWKRDRRANHGERRKKGREGNVTQLPLPRGRELADGAQTSVGCWGAAVVGLRFVLVSVPPPVLNISTFLVVDSTLSDNFSPQPYSPLLCEAAHILWPVSCLEASVQIMSCAVVVTWLVQLIPPLPPPPKHSPMSTSPWHQRKLSACLHCCQLGFIAHMIPATISP